MINFYLAILTSFIVTFLIIPVIIKVVNQNKILLDKPSDRASHKKSMPSFGGIAIFFGILCSIIFWLPLTPSLQFFISAILIIFCIGLVDDLISLSPYKKLIGQLVATIFILIFCDYRITSMYGIFSIHELPYYASLLLTSFTIIVITNAFNLIDGLDGLAGSIGFFTSICFGFLFYINNDLSLSIISFSLATSLLAFLKFNFHPAKIFMGDTGSMVIGFIMSVFAIRLVESNIIFNEYNFEAKGSALAIAILIVPLFDALRIFFIRILKHRSPFLADRNHIHHNLSDLGFGHRRTTLYIFLANLLFVFLVFLIRDLGVNYILLIILILAIFLSQIPIWVKRKNKI